MLWHCTASDFALKVERKERKHLRSDHLILHAVKDRQWVCFWVRVRCCLMEACYFGNDRVGFLAQKGSEEEVGIPQLRQQMAPCPLAANFPLLNQAGQALHELSQ